jgi:hypothetical protein
LHSLLTEAEFSSYWVTLEIDQSNHRLRSKSGCGRGDPLLHRPPPRDLDRIWRPRSSRAQSAWTSGPVSENHPEPVGVQTNRATCQAVTEPSQLERPWRSAWTSGPVIEPRRPKSLSSMTHLVKLYIRLVGTLCVMHSCVKKHQNVRIKDPPVPHFFICRDQRSTGSQ